jgi:phosphatidate cytidylyltransferase
MTQLLVNLFARTPQPLIWGAGAVYAALIAGSLAAVALPRLNPKGDFSNLRERMVSWWAIVLLLTGALVLGWQATSLLFALISFMALREFLSLAPARHEDRLIIALAYLTIPVSYSFVFANIYMFYVVFIPVYVFLIVPFLMACIGQTKGYLTSTAVFHWGVVTCVYNLGYTALLMRVPRWDAPQAGATGLVFLLLAATEANDVFQYVSGKLLGRHKILPKVSPNKTWEGFIGGCVLTSALIVLIGPSLTPLKGIGLWTIALTLPIAGFAGDVTFSAIKRDIGVKDTSHRIPGHGGVLDRVDSLTFTTPLYFHMMAYFALATY